MTEEDKAKHGGNIYAAMRRLGGGFSDYLDFSANINPLGLSSQVRTALIDALDSVTGYPDPDATELKRSVSDCYRVPLEYIETGNGAVELIYLLCRALSPKRVLIPAPTFSEYEAAARAAGLMVKKVPLDKERSFVPSIAELSQMLQPGDLLFFCNPNNPTGAILNRLELEPLIERASSVGAYILFDESFNDFRPEPEEESCRSYIKGQHSVIVLHSLTKFLAVPGLRLGFLLGRPELVGRMKQLRDPWNVNVMAQAAGVAGLADHEYRRKTVAMIAREKEIIRQGLRSIPGIRVFPASVNFVLAEFGDFDEFGRDTSSLQEVLLPHRILIRNCSNFGGLSGRFMRVAVKAPHENQRFLQVLHQIVSGVEVE